MGKTREQAICSEALANQPTPPVEELTETELKELELEDLGKKFGLDRYFGDDLPWTSGDIRHRHRGAFTKVGYSVVATTIPKLTEAIDDFCEQAPRSRTQSEHTARRYLAGFESSEVAAIGSICALNHVTDPKRNALTTIAMKIGDLLEEHAAWSALVEADPRLGRLLQRRLQKGRRRPEGLATRNEVRRRTPKSNLKWLPEDKLALGCTVIALLEESTDLVSTKTPIIGRKRQRTFVTLTKPAKERLREQHRAVALTRPLDLPMVMEPLDWTSPQDGGYRFRRTALVRNATSQQLDAIGRTDMSEIYQGLNFIQSTAWRINRDVLPLLEEYLAEQEPDNSARYYQLAQQCWIARKLQDEQRIWFPHCLDFRGRIYPIPTGLSPQSDEKGRALLEFAEGKPLGAEGAYWLAVHVANRFGQDKKPLDDRVQWVEDHEAEIVDSAERPRDGAQFWREAAGGAEAFTALAACFEWVGYRREGASFVSRLPIALDASCSGLQHLAAASRDEICGPRVNLVPSDACADVYQDVAEAVNEELAPMRGKIAQVLSGKVNRTLVKKPTMTSVYSARDRSFRGQLEEAINESALQLGDVTAKVAAGFLSPIVHGCIQMCIGRAGETMGWFQQCVEVMNEGKLPTRWSSPVGMPVVQRNVTSDGLQVRIYYGGRLMKLRLRRDKRTLDGAAQRRGIVANWVHSHDAAHVIKVAQAAQSTGISALSTIHDSFGTHACDTPMLARIIRETFVAMYQEDRLAGFRLDLEKTLGEAGKQGLTKKLPESPSPGTLDLAGVLDSEFAFS